jgi:hypothetical protein
MLFYGQVVAGLAAPAKKEQPRPYRRQLLFRGLTGAWWFMPYTIFRYKSRMDRRGGGIGQVDNGPISKLVPLRATLLMTLVSTGRNSTRL